LRRAVSGFGCQLIALMLKDYHASGISKNLIRLRFLERPTAFPDRKEGFSR
jgi:hypothetical protein